MNTPGGKNFTKRAKCRTGNTLEDCGETHDFYGMTTAIPQTGQSPHALTVPETIKIARSKVEERPFGAVGAAEGEELIASNHVSNLCVAAC